MSRPLFNIAIKIRGGLMNKGFITPGIDSRTFGPKLSVLFTKQPYITRMRLRRTIGSVYLQ